MEENKDQEKVEIYSQRVRAGKRTYFFDIKSTRSNDYYLTITESKRRFKDDGYFYEKHKIFLYKEDFDKFVEALNGTVDYVKTELMPEVDFSQFKDRGEKEGEKDSYKDGEKESYKEEETPTASETNGTSASDDELKWD